ncbi:hypothetical protein AMK27_12080 [Streptomyces sp. CB02009]|uniref:hypothetical protein n=1 Tax=Streptomyces sp. CB02009 TaxID=1703938 RepID=UPI00093FD5B1|nr:hypothetical protein [Streptomyces sp. CB02009]OKJ63584.1 hypothetical protein AMK27_12080 [Streptomyces sp. CB02009]
MLTHTADDDNRLSLWLRVREFAVPPSMIETAGLRRTAGDWAGACAAAGIDVDLDLRSAARSYGRELAALVRADLRGLAPDLLRWHMPRISPDGVLRPGLTVPLARYSVSTGVSTGAAGRGAAARDDVARDDVARDNEGDLVSRTVYLVVRTAPAWADAGQRMSLALWDESRSMDGERRHPHPRPSRRYRLDLHRHLWDARRSGELRARSGADAEPCAGPPPGPCADPAWPDQEAPRRAVDRWAAEAVILLGAEGLDSGRVRVRLGGRRQLVLDVPTGGGPVSAVPVMPPSATRALPTLPDAATWVPPDLELLRAGLIDPGRLHPLVASALVPDHRPTGPATVGDQPGGPRPVDCRGNRHRIGLSDGVLAPLDHTPAEIRREELLVALGGPPLPCLQAIDDAHRRPDCLEGVRERLDHGDTAGALAVVEGLLGPGAALRNGALRDALESAARRRIAYGLYRADLYGPGPGRVLPARDLPRGRRARSRHSNTR